MKRMTLLWITLQEGVNFVINYSSAGEVFIPSFKVVDLAKGQLKLKLKIVGLRPGEK